MEIAFKNCNNIVDGRILIEEGKLNIKYGANGTGKSTVAKAIEYKIENEVSLKELMPFKLKQENPQGVAPEVNGLGGVSSVKIFNERYLEQFTFKPDELVANSFEIFIKTTNYEQHRQEIEEIVGRLKSVFVDDPTLDEFLKNLQVLSDSFKLTKSGISKASSGIKALESGNKIEHIPTGLEAYEPFLRSATNVPWIGWQQQGMSYSEMSSDCPFCTSPIDDKREIIARVSKEYDKNTISHLNKIIAVFEKLGKYFSTDTQARLEAIAKIKEGIRKEHEEFILSVKGQIDSLIDKLEQLKNLSSQSFADTERVADKIPQLRLELEFFDRLDSTETRRVVDALNGKLDGLANDAGKLQIEINKQRSTTQKIIKTNLGEINSFLTNAGFRYEVRITDQLSGHRLRLKHVECDSMVEGGNQHLSFGERNAFALVLFMFECLSKNPDLIILDDPISSFDKDKKFAILDRLFVNKRQSFRGKTVLLLTHDIEPVIDTIKILRKNFSNISTAHFLKTTNGLLVERQINASDMLSFAQICHKVLKSDSSLVVKIIYLRRYFEIIDDRGDAYEVLANLFKKRQPAEDHRLTGDDGAHELLSASALDQGIERIKQQLEIPDFVYEAMVLKLSDKVALHNLYANASNGYEKLQIYRLIDENHGSSVIRKYINETYHVENDFVCQLDPREFDPIPQYVIDECDRAIAESTPHPSLPAA